MPRFDRRRLLTAGPAVLAGLTFTGIGRSAPAASAPPTVGYRVLSDLTYAAPAGRGHLLDLYLPTGQSRPCPVILYTAGSAFRSDDTKSGESGVAAVPGSPTGLGGLTSAARLAAMWAPHGYAVAGVNVRSSAEGTFPAQLHDIKAAIRYLRAHAGSYGLDTGRFATMGTSSGGWVAAMAGVTAGIAHLEGDLGNPDQSSAVNAVIDLFGPTDFLQMDAHRLSDGQIHDAPDSPESQLMGFPLQSDPVAVARANPAAYVNPQSPPIFITHGTADPLVPFNQSEILFGAYREAGATATLVLVPGAVHTDSYLTSAAASAGRVVMHTSGGVVTTGSEPPPTYEALLGFLDAQLRA